MSNHDTWLEAPYDRMADAADRYTRLKEQYEAEAEKDCSDAVHAADENRVTRALIDLGNQARHVRKTGDIDDKIAFVDSMCLRIDLLIRDYAEEQAERAIERGDDEDGPDPDRQREDRDDREWAEEQAEAAR